VAMRGDRGRYALAFSIASVIMRASLLFLFRDDSHQDLSTAIGGFGGGEGRIDGGDTRGGVGDAACEQVGLYQVNPVLGQLKAGRAGAAGRLALGAGAKHVIDLVQRIVGLSDLSVEGPETSDLRGCAARRRGSNHSANLPGELGTLGEQLHFPAA